MEATLENTDATEVVVTVTVPADEFKTELENGFKQLSQNVKMKGFRPGKVPRSILEKAHGQQLRSECQQHFVQRGLQEIVQEKALRPVGQPHFTKDDLEVADDGSFTCRVSLMLRPEYTLGDYKGLAVDAPKVEVTDEEVDTALEQFQQSQGRPEPAADGLKEDGMALANVEVLHGEETLMSRDGVRLAIGTVPPGLDEEAYKAALLGTTDGTEHVLEMTFPDDFQPEELRGEQGTCKITVSQVFDMTRPTEEELIKMVGAEDMADLKEKVRADIQRQKQAQVDAQVELQLLESLIGSHGMDVPERLVADQIENRKRALFEQLTQQGSSPEDAGKAIEEQGQALRNEALHNTKALFLMEDIAQAEDLGVKNEDVGRKFQEIAQRNQTSVDEVQKYYQENNLLNQLAMEILELKVRAFLRENAEISEVDPS